MRTPLLIGIPGQKLTPRQVRHLQSLQPAGVLLFGRNYGNRRQLKQLIRDVKTVLGDDCRIAIDHEGGRIVRIPDLTPELPAAAILGGWNRAEIRKLASAIGDSLANLGITDNLAPVLDIAGISTHPTLRDRCYGADPYLVADAGTAFIEGMRESGTRCTAKHFPGLGEACTDTHDGVTIVRSKLEELEAAWIPFRAAIDAGVDAVMTSHAIYPEVDPHQPASISKTLIRRILRVECNFKGDVVSDDLVMGAISRRYAITEAATQAIQAGCDLLTVGHNMDLQSQAYRALRECLHG